MSGSSTIAGPTASSAVPPQCWDGTTLATSLHEENYQAVMDVLDDAINVKRDPRAINWSIEYGYRRGHVPVLWHLSRNFLRFSNGRVPSCEDLAFGVRCAVLMLLRVAQDVVSCKVDLAKADRDFVYTALATEVSKWVLRWDNNTLPTRMDIAAELARWIVAVDVLPLPTWATSFASGFLKWKWTQPTATDTASFRRCAKLAETRLVVADKFIALLRDSPSWAAFLRVDVTLAVMTS